MLPFLLPFPSDVKILSCVKAVLESEEGFATSAIATELAAGDGIEVLPDA